MATSTSLAATPKHNLGIDALRGLSILLVVLHHVALRISLHRGVLANWAPRRLLNAVMYNGYEAVFIFFVISGFLITSSICRRFGRLGSIGLRWFYSRRAARIGPPLVALVAVLSLLHSFGLADYRITHANQSLGRAIVAALGFHLNWYEGVTGYLPGSWDVLWSLSIEEVFYFGFPFVCLALRRSAVIAVLAAGIAMTLPFSRALLENNEIWQEKAYAPGIAAISLGVFTATVSEMVRPPPAVVRNGLVGLGAAGIGSVLFVEDLLWARLGNGTVLLLAISAACMVLGFSFRERAGGGARLRGLGWLRSFGRLSYEIYLTHMFVVFSAVGVWKAVVGSERYGAALYVLCALISWGVGAVVARLFSGPAERATQSLLLRAHSR